MHWIQDRSVTLSPQPDTVDIDTFLFNLLSTIAVVPSHMTVVSCVHSNNHSHVKSALTVSRLHDGREIFPVIKSFRALTIGKAAP